MASEGLFQSLLVVLTETGVKESTLPVDDGDCVYIFLVSGIAHLNSHFEVEI
jgi:hypothetical protein